MGNSFENGWCVLLTSLMLLFSSCFKDEAPNAECDILKSYVSMASPEDVFFHLSDTLVTVLETDSVVTFKVKTGADVSRMSPFFLLTEGASIYPPSGSEHDFSRGPVAYRVVSENGLWHRDYQVGFFAVQETGKDTVSYSFEHFMLENTRQKYYIWQNQKEDGSWANEWASGNAGFGLTKGSASPMEYPTVPKQEGYKGWAVQLTTLSTGALGESVGKPIAAGNLFLGTFNLTSALISPLNSTRFGVPFDRQPISFSGYYTYQPGPEYKDENGHLCPELADSAAIYAVLFVNHDANGQAVTLSGEDVKTSSLIVAIADMGYVRPVDSWTRFEVPFIYSKPIDPLLLASRGYSLTLVFSSSQEGDYFKGAIGSTLCIDEVEVVCE